MSRNRIDVHAHYIGGSVSHRLSNELAAAWTADAAIEFMDRFEIATQVLSVPGDVLAVIRNQGDPDRYARFIRAVNEEYAELIRAYPRRFGAFAAVAFGTAGQALDEIRHALDELGLDGVALPRHDTGRYLGNPFYEPIFSELARRGTPIYLHPAECPHISDLSLGRQGWIVELPLDTARTITDAIFAGTFKRHPGLTMILAHAGGALPALAWRITEHANLSHTTYSAVGKHDDPGIDAAHVTHVLRNQLYYDTGIAGSPHSLLPALQVTGPDHILFGTDWPFVTATTVETLDQEMTALEKTTDITLPDIDRTNALPSSPASPTDRAPCSETHPLGFLRGGGPPLELYSLVKAAPCIPAPETRDPVPLKLTFADSGHPARSRTWPRLRSPGTAGGATTTPSCVPASIPMPRRPGPGRLNCMSEVRHAIDARNACRP